MKKIIISVPLRCVQARAKLRAEDHGRHVVWNGGLSAALPHHVQELHKGGDDGIDDDLDDHAHC